MNISFIQEHIWIFVLLGAWEVVWKGFALWHAAKNSKKVWFVALLIVNTVGILPIIYLTFFSKPIKKGGE